jgi:hypothetical protein
VAASAEALRVLLSAAAAAATDLPVSEGAIS